jgi:hypothetical protein
MPAVFHPIDSFISPILHFPPNNPQAREKKLYSLCLKSE